MHVSAWFSYISMEYSMKATSYSIFLVTHKRSRSKIIHVIKNEKDIFKYYSAKEYLIELIEKQSNKHLIATRKPIWERTYGSFTFRSDVLIRRTAKGFKRPIKSMQMKLKNPSHGGLSALHRYRIGMSNRGKKKTGRGPMSEERRKWQSAVMRKYKNAKGWFWIVNVLSDEEKRFNGWPIPSGWKRGRSVVKMQEAIWLREQNRRNRKQSND